MLDSVCLSIGDKTEESEAPGGRLRIPNESGLSQPWKHCLPHTVKAPVERTGIKLSSLCPGLDLSSLDEDPTVIC
jgi:hypothetical protein